MNVVGTQQDARRHVKMFRPAQSSKPPFLTQPHAIHPRERLMDAISAPMAGRSLCNPAIVGTPILGLFRPDLMLLWKRLGSLARVQSATQQPASGIKVPV